MSTYFGGRHWLKSPDVQKLGPTDFRSLIDGYFNNPAPIRLTRDEFFALSEDDQKLEKAGPYICAVTFKESPCRRCDPNAEKLVLVCLDLDGGDFVKDFDESPEAISDALHPYNFIAYRTASYRPEDPHLRIIVELKPCDLSKHKTLVRHVTDLLGIPPEWCKQKAGHRESNVLTQPMAKPVIFEGEEFTAVLASRVTGDALDWREVPEETIEEITRIYAYQAVDEDDLGSLFYLPVPGLKVTDIKEALVKIDPDCDYRTWTEIACALKHQFRDEEEAKEAYEAFHDWSYAEGAASKYKDEESTWRKWKSFKPEVKGRNPITIRSLFKYAIDAGWESSKVAAKIQKRIASWIDDYVDGALLKEEGGRRIAEMPFSNEVVEESLIIAWRNKITKLTGEKIDKATLKKAVARMRSRIRAEADDGNMPTWLRPWCFVTGLDRFYNTVTGERLTPEAFNRTFGDQLMPGEDDPRQAESGRPLVSAADYALNLKLIPKVSGILYDPRFVDAENGSPYFNYRGRQWVNEYRTSTVPRETKHKINRVRKVILDHLRILIAEEEYVRRIVDWMAFVVQNTGVKIKWSPLIQSAQGAGKSILLDLLKSALGRENVKGVDPVVLVNQSFNDWLYGAQVIGLEEIWVSGPNRASVMNQLKPAVTNPEITIHRKFESPVQVDNTINLLAFTNHFNALYMEEDDRRWMVVESAIQSKAQVQALRDKKHFDPIYKIIAEYGGTVRHWLMSHEISPDFDHKGEAPDTIYRRDMVEASKNPMQKRIESLIRNPDETRVAVDVVDLSVVHGATDDLKKGNHPAELFLKKLGYLPWDMGREIPVNGHITQVWYHREDFDGFFGDPPEVLERRTARLNEKDL